MTAKRKPIKRLWVRGEKLLYTTTTSKKTVVTVATFHGYHDLADGNARAYISLDDRPRIAPFSTNILNLSGAYDLGEVE